MNLLNKNGGACYAAALITLIVFCSAGVVHGQGCIFEDDFEMEDLGWWVVSKRGESAVEVSEDICRSGLFSAYSYVDPNAVYNECSAYFYRAFDTSSDDYFQVFVYLGSDFTLNSGDETNFITLESSVGGAQERVYLHNSGNGNYVIRSTKGGLGTKVLQKEKWYCVGIRYKAGVGDGEVEFWIDGQSDIKADSLTLNPIGRCSLGFRWITGDGRGGSMYFDDVVIDDQFVPVSPSKAKMRSSTGFGRTELRIDLTLAGYEATDKIVATIDGTKVFEKNGCLKGREIVKLDLGSVAKGIRTVEVKLLTSKDIEKARDTIEFEKFTNAGAGDPTVAIDGENNIIYDGEKLFPVTPYMVNQGDIGPRWSDPGRINQMGWCSGYALEYNVPQYRAYLDECENQGMLMIGPGQRYRNYHLGTPRQASLPDIIDYVTNLKSHNSVFMWTWTDEPNLGGTNPYHHAAEVKEWTDACHAIDTDHPVILNFGGLHPEMTLEKGYLDNVADVYGFDLYPVAYAYVDFNQWTDTILKHINYTYNLAPWFSFVEVTDIEASDPEPCPTPAQIKMETWINVACGVKGVSWFPHFTEPPVENYNEMAKFVVDVGILKDAILSSVSDVYSVSDNANIPGNRVEAMIREYEGDIYIFAVRVTEPSETNTINVTFTVGGVTELTAAVYDESRSLEVVGGVFSDDFAPCDVHIYRLSSLQPPENLKVGH